MPSYYVGRSTKGDTSVCLADASGWCDAHTNAKRKRGHSRIRMVSRQAAKSQSKNRSSWRFCARLSPVRCRQDIPLVECPFGPFRFRHPALDVLHAAFIAGMVGKNLGNFPPLVELLHARPKARCFFRVVAGERHQKDADVIRFGFLPAIEGFVEKNADAAGFIAGDPFIRMVSQ